MSPTVGDQLHEHPTLNIATFAGVEEIVEAFVDGSCRSEKSQLWRVQSGAPAGLPVHNFPRSKSVTNELRNVHLTH